MSPFDGVQCDVRPDDNAAFVVKIKSNGVLQSVNDGRVFLFKERNLANVNSICKDQTHRLTECFARFLIRSQHVAVDATATESAHCVGAQLTAVHLSGAFVHIETTETVAGQSETTATTAGGRPVGENQASVLASAGSFAFLLNCAVHFIFTAGTVAFAVAYVNFGNTRVVGAWELVFSAMVQRTVLFILAVGTVRFAITGPSCRNTRAALTRTVARDLMRTASLSTACYCVTILLVNSWFTVLFSIASNSFQFEVLVS